MLPSVSIILSLVHLTSFLHSCIHFDQCKLGGGGYSQRTTSVYRLVVTILCLRTKVFFSFCNSRKRPLLNGWVPGYGQVDKIWTKEQKTAHSDTHQVAPTGLCAIFFDLTLRTIRDQECAVHKEQNCARWQPECIPECNIYNKWRR